MSEFSAVLDKPLEPSAQQSVEQTSAQHRRKRQAARARIIRSLNLKSMAVSLARSIEDDVQHWIMASLC
jgi:hypothetical protein